MNCQYYQYIQYIRYLGMGWYGHVTVYPKPQRNMETSLPSQQIPCQVTGIIRFPLHCLFHKATSTQTLAFATFEAWPHDVLLMTQGTCDASVNWGAKKDGSPLGTRASLLKVRKDTWQHDSEDILKGWRTSKYHGECYTTLDMDYTGNRFLKYCVQLKHST